MRCQDVMKMGLVTCSPSDTAARAARIMRDRNLGILPVVDPADLRLVGVVTDRDLALRILGEVRELDTEVAEVMTRDLVTCGPEDDLRVAEERMAEAGKSRILVVDEGRCVGLISLADVGRNTRLKRAGRLLRAVASRHAPSGH